MSTYQMPTMHFYGCEVDPKGAYEVVNDGEVFTVKRNGIEIGPLPDETVRSAGPLEAATMLIGYGCYITKQAFRLGPIMWASDWFPRWVDRRVSEL